MILFNSFKTNIIVILSENIIQNIENFTIFIKNDIQFKKFEIKRFILY